MALDQTAHGAHARLDLGHRRRVRRAYPRLDGLDAVEVSAQGEHLGFVRVTGLVGGQGLRDERARQMQRIRLQRRAGAAVQAQRVERRRRERGLQLGIGMRRGDGKLRVAEVAAPAGGGRGGARRPLAVAQRDDGEGEVPGLGVIERRKGWHGGARNPEAHGVEHL